MQNQTYGAENTCGDLQTGQPAWSRRFAAACMAVIPVARCAITAQVYALASMLHATFVRVLASLMVFMPCSA
jgi:Mn2+/Fe2+ NRAMP family transporter